MTIYFNSSIQKEQKCRTVLKYFNDLNTKSELLLLIYNIYLSPKLILISRPSKLTHHQKTEYKNFFLQRLIRFFIISFDCSINSQQWCCFQNFYWNCSFSIYRVLKQGCFFLQNLQPFKKFTNRICQFPLLLDHLAKIKEFTRPRPRSPLLTKYKT